MIRQGDIYERGRRVGTIEVEATDERVARLEELMAEMGLEIRWSHPMLLHVCFYEYVSGQHLVSTKLPDAPRMGDQVQIGTATYEVMAVQWQIGEGRPVRVLLKGPVPDRFASLEEPR